MGGLEGMGRLGMSPGLAVIAGVALLSALTVYPAIAATRRAPLRLGPVEAPTPPPRVALAQIFLGIADALFAGLALTILLGESPAQILPTLAAFALASTAAAASGIPAGLGSFEAVLLLLSPVAPDRMAAAL